jgi:hypothetical protein
MEADHIPTPPLGQINFRIVKKSMENISFGLQKYRKAIFKGSVYLFCSLEKSEETKLLKILLLQYSLDSNLEYCL